MTQIELLFREYRRQKVISPEEFIHAGWSIEEYLTYIRLCDNIRSTCMCVFQLSKKLHSNEKLRRVDGGAVENTLFKYEIDALSEWLSQYFDEPLSISGIFVKFGGATYGGSYIVCKNEEDKLCNIISMSLDDFRYELEQEIRKRLLGDYGDDIRKISTEELYQMIDERENLYRCNIKPPFPSGTISYDIAQRWASEYIYYKDIEENIDIEIDAIEEEITSRFSPSKDILYVFSGNPKCLTEHEVECVTAMVVGLNNITISLNVNYCSDCKKYFIKFSEYERYMSLYKYLPIRIVKIDEAASSTFYNRKPQSDLSLCGYTVAAKANLSDDERHELLALLIDSGTFAKYEIIAHIDMLINTNGQQLRMYEARQKWIEDLDFVRSYNMDKQDHVGVTRIRSASKNLFTTDD